MKQQPLNTWTGLATVAISFSLPVTGLIAESRIDRLESQPTTTQPASHPSPPAATRPARGPIAPPRRDVPGQRITLATGVLYIPDFFHAAAGAPVDMVVWFHGAAWCAEQVFYDAGRNAVLVTVNVKDYWNTFRAPAGLGRILEEAQTQLAKQRGADVTLGKVCLASFSGGYVAVREILKHDRYAAQISDVVLADSLYAPRIPGAANQLDPQAMIPFLTYARRAAAGECTFWFSHLYPPEPMYRNNTTTLAANYLIDKIEATRKPTTKKTCRGASIAYRADAGGFHVLGYEGMTTQDHFEHFYGAADLLRQTSLQPANQPGGPQGTIEEP